MKTIATQKNESRAVSKFIRMSPSKIRRVLTQIQGKSYSDALLILEFLPYTSCEPIIKVLRSAAANAKKQPWL
jgi:large subunit ribosomal protein L22